MYSQISNYVNVNVIPNIKLCTSKVSCKKNLKSFQADLVTLPPSRLFDRLLFFVLSCLRLASILSVLAFASRLLMVSLNEYLLVAILGSLGVLGEVKDDDVGSVPVVFGVEGCNCAEECFPYSKF